MLDLGGFCISRYSFDNYLYRVAQREGVSFKLNSEVSAVNFDGNLFEIQAGPEKMYCDLVIGSFGKRSRIDIQQNRSFVKKRSPYLGVKYHVRNNHPRDLISLHNFSGGYCGIAPVEDEVTNLCYLTNRDNLRRFGDIAEMESQVLYKNPMLKEIFTTSSFIFKKPEVINEISFETKRPVENHILMAGDAAGMITPVCGNGMAIAIHSAKILSQLVIDYCNGKIDRKALEKIYLGEWNSAFRSRLWFGRNVQRLFGNPRFSTLAVKVARSSKGVANFIVSGTHGKSF